ncbi:MAG TPA: hypothetical protein VIC08_11685 [Cellvibrionaceae bacterium]
MTRWLFLIVLIGSLTACMTLSGTYRLAAYDNEGNPLDDSISMVAEGNGIYTARNGMCHAFPGALIRITDTNTGEELNGESPFQCRGQLQQNNKTIGDNLERWDFEFDQRTWIIGNQGTDSTQTAVEYILAGEDINSWSELVTSHSKIIDPSIPVYGQIQQMGGVGAYLFSHFERDFAEKCQDPYLNVIDSSTGDILFEWRHNGCSEYPPQHQIQRVVDTDSGMLSLSYVKKTPQLDELRRSQWIELLRAASYKPE